MIPNFNLFINEYKKIGIACGPHQTEFQMCVMDFAGDFGTPAVNNNANNIENNNVDNNNMDNNNNMEMNIKMNKEDMMNNSNFANNMNNVNNTKNPNNQSPLVKLSLDNDDLKNNIGNQNLVANNQNINMPQNQNVEMVPNGLNDIDKAVFDTMDAMNNLRILSKKVEITTTVTYTYEDGSTRNVTQFQTHEYK